MTECEVSSERDDAAFLRGMALAYATDDNEHSQKGAARLREIADNILALRSSVKTMGTCDSLREAAEAVCRKLESETASVTIFDQEALRSALSAIEAPSEGEAVAKDAGPGFECYWDEDEYSIKWADGPWLHAFASGKISVSDVSARSVQSYTIQDLARPSPVASSEVTHPDDIAVDRFAAAMKAKLAKKREEGRGGWERKDECSADFLSDMLREHVVKGDPVDVANFAMMLHQRGERIAAAASEVTEEMWFDISIAPKGTAPDHWDAPSILVSDGHSVDQVEWEAEGEFWHATGGKRKSGNYLGYEPVMWRHLPTPSPLHSREITHDPQQ